MPLEQSSLLIANLEKRLGRELSPSERHLLLLAEEIFEGDGARHPEQKAQSRGA